MLNRKFDVYGVGNAIMDLQIQVSEEELSSTGFEKAGMTLVGIDEQKALIENFKGKKINRTSGGSAANTLIAMSQLGAKTAYACLLADDENGRFYSKEMEEIGVTLHTDPVQGEMTGTCAIMITPDAERTMVTHLGASSGLSSTAVNKELLVDSEWLYVEGYLFSSEEGRDAVDRAISLAVENDVKVAITFSDGFIVDVFGDPLREAVKKADLVFANLNEATRFTGVVEEEKVFSELCKVVPNAVMTMSERGVRVFYNGESVLLDAFPTTAIDDTGAGDMFAGGFLYGISQGKNGEDAGRLASFLASKVVSQLGPRLQGNVRELAAECEAA